MLRKTLNSIHRVNQRWRRWRHGALLASDGLILDVSSRRITDGIAERLASGTYDAADRLLIKRYIGPGAFVLEFGTGCGVTAMTAKRQVGNAGRVVTIEPDREMFEIAQHNFQLNGISVEGHHGAAVHSPDTPYVEFYAAVDFWDSAITKPVRPTLSRSKVAAFYPPDVIPRDPVKKVLICDVEGYETQLLTNPEIVGRFDTIIAEIHNFGWPQKADSRGIGALFRGLEAQGFEIVESLCHSWVWRRTLGQ